ncbi:hypothetical protein EI546_10905 [Aequorivita sp. H23M31]|uniref:Uncharacterized protein n=1 Tax=Aequorivita ciconiae TaxID=2494375 RepID=A0A410G4N0_9FLAO|nr:hypothetical protein [Aequorivita sp. H23M31]QAA82201.1 hypothetical protein EI546_10905 [Aequorivita sp. H23M31]
MAQQHSSEEIDLGYFFRKSNDVFKRMARGIFEILHFFKRFFIWILLLIIIGFAIGYYKDTSAVAVYDNRAIIIPNFESVDYVYDKIEAVNSKIKARDTTYLKTIFGENAGKVGIMEIEAIVDIYNFVSKSRTNIDILRILSQNQNFSEYVNDVATSKYYKYHRFKIPVLGKDASEKVVADFFKYLNENEHFKAYQEVYTDTKAFDIKEHYDMVSQVDSLVEASSRMYSVGSNVSVNNNSDLHFLIERKRLLIEDIYQLRTDLLDYSTPIKIVSVDYNLKPERLLEIPNKVKFPIFLVFLFSMVFFVIYLFKHLRTYAELEKPEPIDRK